MTARVREEEGIFMVELIVAMAVLSIAILALMGGYSAAFSSLHTASRQTVGATIANKQLELYSALQYTSIGLDATTLSSVKATNTTYVNDEAGLSNAATATDVTISGCGTATQCLPVQTITGSDSHAYTVETFIRDIPVTTRSERFVTIIVRDPGATGNPLVAQLTAGFDSGP